MSTSNHEIWHAYQKQLIYAGNDEFTAGSVLPGYYGGQFGGNKKLWWQAAVDFFYRNLCTNLIAPNFFHSTKFPINELKKLCEIFASIDPNTENFDVISLWDYFQFQGTDTLREILSKHQLSGWGGFNEPVNIGFIHEVCLLYKHEKLDDFGSIIIPV